MIPAKKQKLFIVTGASGVGKSTACEILFQNEADYIIIESDLMWHEVYDTPDDKYREMQLRLCAAVSQIGKSAVLCGCGIPKQFERCGERGLFTEIYYLALVCGEDTLKERMRCGRKITNENWIKSSVDFNRWLKENAGKTKPKIELLDTTKLSPKQAAEITDEWIRKYL